MKKSLIIVIAFLFSGILTTFSQSINSKKSEVKFHITGGGIFKVKGTFKGMKGDFNFKTNDLESSNFDICIDASSVNTKNKKRDDHLINEDFFYVEKYPEICFQSSSVSKTETGYITKGELSLHGVTKEIEIPFEFTNNTFTGSIVVDRFDYDLGNEFGTMRVGKEATITIVCVIE